MVILCNIIVASTLLQSVVLHYYKVGIISKRLSIILPHIVSQIFISIYWLEKDSKIFWLEK